MRPFIPINCSRADETVYTDLKDLAAKQPNYWTLIIARHDDRQSDDPS